MKLKKHELFKIANKNTVAECSEELGIPLRTLKRYIHENIPLSKYNEIMGTTTQIENSKSLSWIDKSLKYYHITRAGEVFSEKRNLYMKLSEHNGYLVFSFRVNQIQKREFIHRLVAKAFIPNDKNKSQVNHIDGNKKNNSVENLEWCTPDENLKHAWDSGLITKEKIQLASGKSIKANGIIYNSQREAEEELGLSNGTIYRYLKKEKFVIEKEGNVIILEKLEN